MTREQRAAQIWPILTLCATRRQSLTYDQLARLIGVLRPGLGQLLEPMQSYCILNSLPPLTVLVVSNIDGVPGPGFIAAEHVPSAQAQVYSFDWLSRQPPDAQTLAQATSALPSNGASLKELEAKKESISVR